MPEVKDDNKIKEMIDNLVKRARIAADEYTKLSQDQVDRIVKAMSMAGEEHHMYAAQSTCHWKLINDQSEARQPIEAAGGVSETDNARRRFRVRQHSRSET